MNIDSKLESFSISKNEQGQTTVASSQEANSK